MPWSGGSGFTSVGGGNGTGWTDTVNAYANLPLASEHTGEVYLVESSTGFLWNRRKGLYISDGSNWNRLSNAEFKVTDSESTMVDDLDNNKQLKWELSNITSGFLRTIKIPDRELDLNKPVFDTESVDTTYTETGAETVGTSWWNVDDETLNTKLNSSVTLQHGHEMMIAAKNQSGASIADGTPVKFAGTLGASGKVLIEPATADSSTISSHTIGLTTETIANGGDGKVTVFGKVRGIDTTGALSFTGLETWVDGDILYVDPVNAGYLTKVQPQAPNKNIEIAVVITSHTNGTVLTRPTFQSTFTDLDDVNGTPLTTDGQIAEWHNTEKYFDFTKNINDYAKLAGDEFVGQVLITDNTGTQLILQYDGTNKAYFQVDNTGDLAIDSTGGNIVTSSLLDTSANIKIGKAVPEILMQTDESKNEGTILGQIAFGSKLSALFRSDSAYIKVAYDELVTNSGTTRMEFWTTPSGSTNVEQLQMVIKNDGKVGIGTNAPAALLDVNGDVLIQDLTPSTSSTTGALVVSGGAGIADDVNIGGDLDLRNDASSTTKLTLTESSTGSENNAVIEFTGRNLSIVTTAGGGSNRRINLSTGGAGEGIINLFPASTNSNGRALELTDNLGMNVRVVGQYNATNAPETVFNELAQLTDFRVESSTDTHALFVDSSADRIGIGTATPSTKLDVNGVASVQDNIVVPKTKGKGILIDTASADYGWRDLIAKIQLHGVGANEPVYNIYRNGLRGYQFNTINDEAFIEFHVPHDYAPGTDIFIHTHWSHTNATTVTTGSVTWDFETTYAKGHNQAAFPASVIPSVTHDASVTNVPQYQHMISEVQLSATTPSGTQINTNDLETDGLILVRVALSANTLGTDPFLHFVDIHYQSTNLPTKQKAPDFWT